MSMVRLELRELLEERTGALLSIAGGFLLLQIAVETVPALVGFAVRERLTGWAGLVFSTGLLGVGLGIPFVALFGLYHRLTAETPRLAGAGVALMALTPVLFLSGLLTVLVRPVPDSPYLLFLGPLPSVAGAGSFGLAFFRKDSSVRFVGVPLLVFSGTWTLTYAVGLENGELPGWLPFVELLAVSLVTMGYLLTAHSTTNDPTPAGS